MDNQQQVLINYFANTANKIKIDLNDKNDYFTKININKKYNYKTLC